MNRLQSINSQLNESNQLYQNKHQQLCKLSKICPLQMRHIIFGGHDKYIKQIYSIIQKNQQVFSHADIEDNDRKQQRKQATRQMLLILKSYKIQDLKKEGYKFAFGMYALVSYSLGLSIKTNIQYMLYLKTLITFSTTQYHQQLIKKAYNLQHLGCFALTQLYHGSYTKGIATQATYDHSTKSFRITTNGNKGMKFWIGAAAQIANMAVLWAQIIVQNKCYGPHPFVVQIRDFNTHQLIKGILIGDCGDKFGLNGIDNGYFILDNIVVPKENLLNGLGGIDQNGNYVSKIKSNQQRFGLHMSPLSSGRASLSYSSLSCSTNALAIASRYVCQRRQFSDPKSKVAKETLLIQYPLTKFRLIPMIAQNLIYLIGGLFITKQYVQNTQIFTDASNSLVPQLHAISAILKAKSTWFSNKTITECRQLLGGHGYSSFSRLGRIYAENDVHSTWEGDNHMLLQQTSKFLLKSLQTKKQCSVIDIKFMFGSYQQKPDFNNLTCWKNLEIMLKNIIVQKYTEVIKKMIQLKAQKLSSWEQWNRLQPHFCNGLSLAFGDYVYLQKTKQVLTKCQHQPTKVFIQQALTLWLLKVIENTRFENYQLRVRVQQKIIELCDSLTSDCIYFIDTIRPPNFIIDSPFVKDEPMKQYINLLMTGKNTFRRVDWYQKLIELKNQ